MASSAVAAFVILRSTSPMIRELQMSPIVDGPSPSFVTMSWSCSTLGELGVEANPGEFCGGLGLEGGERSAPGVPGVHPPSSPTRLSCACSAAALPTSGDPPGDSSLSVALPDPSHHSPGTHSTTRKWDAGLNLTLFLSFRFL
jgi:hypothetical protein